MRGKQVEFCQIFLFFFITEMRETTKVVIDDTV
jgi:hypothetical protein